MVVCEKGEGRGGAGGRGSDGRLPSPPELDPLCFSVTRAPSPHGLKTAHSYSIARLLCGPTHWGSLGRGPSKTNTKHTHTHTHTYMRASDEQEGRGGGGSLQYHHRNNRKKTKQKKQKKLEMHRLIWTESSRWNGYRLTQTCSTRSLKQVFKHVGVRAAIVSHWQRGKVNTVRFNTCAEIYLEAQASSHVTLLSAEVFCLLLLFKKNNNNNFSQTLICI